MSETRRVLNVGGNSKKIAIPARYEGWQHDLLDIDPAGKPEIVCDAREMHTLPAGSYDAIYCSHNLEHFAPHDVPKVLTGFLHVLKPSGYAEIRVPSVRAAMREMLLKNKDLEDEYYKTGSGEPITFRDILYGHARHVAQQDFWAHKTGFSTKTLLKALGLAGFKAGLAIVGRPSEIAVVGFPVQPSADVIAGFQRAPQTDD
jgi:hypothetical protein